MLNEVVAAKLNSSFGHYSYTKNLTNSFFASENRTLLFLPLVGRLIVTGDIIIPNERLANFSPP